jgi:hypothetical protein
MYTAQGFDLGLVAKGAPDGLLDPGRDSNLVLRVRSSVARREATNDSPNSHRRQLTKERQA